MREIEDRLYNQRHIGPRPKPKLSELKRGDGRNNALFRQLGREAHHVDDFDQLLDRAIDPQRRIRRTDGSDRSHEDRQQRLEDDH